MGPIILTTTVNAAGYQIEMVKLAIYYGANDFNHITSLITVCGCVKILMLAINHGTNFNEIALFTIKVGYIDIIQLAIDHGADNFNSIASNIMFSTLIFDTIKLIIDEGVDDYSI
jgi:hypothetical protein